MIGVLGASGAVGRHAVEALIASGCGPLRLGARKPEALSAEFLTQAVETRAVDATEEASLAAFCDGTQVVLNCAGPSYLLKDSVARAALRAGADYVDVLGDDPAREALSAAGEPATERTVVLSAGTVPGLSALVPYVLMEGGAGTSPPERLVAYAGGLERATPTVAADILLSLDVGGANGEPFGLPLAAWRHGRREQRALRVEENAEIPFHPRQVALQPLLTAEVERLAAAMGLREAEWYNVFPGQQIRSLFTALPTLPVDTPEEREAVIARILTAGQIDLAGAEPYYRLVMTLSGEDWSRTGVVSTDDSYRLTGATAAHTVRALLDGRIPPGLHFAADVLKPRNLIDDLVLTKAADFSVYEGAAGSGERDGMGFEDGEL
ncbi:saccharopine dehydrogenase NADP-binding domain-containing protein [Streptomyces sp. PTY087I2]|uniref:saccharopine dehydrogenase NADP-binding domain-containing protein n=1 Tax=Streptomyces sp. PTY087I2 TaxID=1819298 RepID=UPI00080BE080|nr:saccharopine dehydrogenase NADP-binding domain-containing protein [Streptomyces sp. PTY087I2]OCC14040.1 Saccharopine dehydrogenase [Streptomyces sp. PTY087I2]